METEVTTTEARPTAIRTVSVKVSRQVDLGFVPYIKYIKALNGKQIPFGTRDQSRAEVDIFVSAEVGTGDSLEEVILMLSDKAHDLSDQILRENYPDAFREAVQQEVPEEAFTIQKTIVARAMTEEF
jgi:hypothetical protein